VAAADGIRRRNKCEISRSENRRHDFLHLHWVSDRRRPVTYGCSNRGRKNRSPGSKTLMFQRRAAVPAVREGRRLEGWCWSGGAGQDWIIARRRRRRTHLHVGDLYGPAQGRSTHAACPEKQKDEKTLPSCRHGANANTLSAHQVVVQFPEVISDSWEFAKRSTFENPKLHGAKHGAVPSFRGYLPS